MTAAANTTEFSTRNSEPASSTHAAIEPFDREGKNSQSPRGVRLVIPLALSLALLLCVSIIAALSYFIAARGLFDPCPKAVPNTWEKVVSTSNIPGPRLAHAAVGTSTYMYIHGGLYGSLNATYDDLWRYDEPKDAWEQLRPTGDVPPARLHHTLMDRDDQTMFLFGGFNVFNTDPSHKSYDDLYRLDVKNLVWRKIEPASATRPSARGSHEGAIVNDYMYIFGGFAKIGASGQNNELWRYSITENVWVDLTMPPGARGPIGRIGFSMAAIGNLIYIFGGGCDAALNGTSQQGQCGDSWVYNTVLNAWSEVTSTNAQYDSPRPRRATNGDVAAYGLIYLFGGVYIGINNTNITLFDDLWVFDPLNGANRWMQLHPNYDRPIRPPPSFGNSIVLVGKKLMVFGGRINSPASPGSNQVWEFNLIPPE